MKEKLPNVTEQQDTQRFIDFSATIRVPSSTNETFVSNADIAKDEDASEEENSFRFSEMTNKKKRPNGALDKGKEASIDEGLTSRHFKYKARILTPGGCDEEEVFSRRSGRILVSLF